VESSYTESRSSEVATGVGSLALLCIEAQEALVQTELRLTTKTVVHSGEDDHKAVARVSGSTHQADVVTGLA
jgi:hypothetical protein